MPELPEVEVLARHLNRQLSGRQVRRVRVLIPKWVRPHSAEELDQTLSGGLIQGVGRRAKFLLFQLTCREGRHLTAIGHLGMTGRIFLQQEGQPLPKHAAVVMELDRDRLIFEDPRRFGRFNLNLSSLNALGPEPWDEQFTAEVLFQCLQRSRQAIKVKLLDQQLVAGVGNIYACEILFRAGIPPRMAACALHRKQVKRLHEALRTVLSEAIGTGLGVSLDFAGGTDGLFYFGSGSETATSVERFQVYGRRNQPCFSCGAPVVQFEQGGRSTYACPTCQPTGKMSMHEGTGKGTGRGIVATNSLQT
jgi:formamidopyrimidine-DNA glycosylase